MSYCTCAICNPDEPPIEKRVAQYVITVCKLSSGFWATKVGSQWLPIEGTRAMTLEGLRKAKFTDLEDVRAHPNSCHFDEEYRDARK